MVDLDRLEEGQTLRIVLRRHPILTDGTYDVTIRSVDPVREEGVAEWLDVRGVTARNIPVQLVTFQAEDSSWKVCFSGLITAPDWLRLAAHLPEMLALTALNLEGLRFDVSMRLMFDVLVQHGDTGHPWRWQDYFGPGDYDYRLYILTPQNVGPQYWLGRFVDVETIELVSLI